jgi:hypothetical protein
MGEQKLAVLMKDAGEPLKPRKNVRLKKRRLGDCGIVIDSKEQYLCTRFNDHLKHPLEVSPDRRRTFSKGFRMVLQLREKGLHRHQLPLQEMHGRAGETDKGNRQTLVTDLIRERLVSLIAGFKPGVVEQIIEAV